MGSVPKNSINMGNVPKNNINMGSVPKNNINMGSVPKNSINMGSVPKNNINTARNWHHKIRRVLQKAIKKFNWIRCCLRKIHVILHRDIILFGKSHHSSPFGVIAGGVTIAAIPICRERLSRVSV